MKTFEKAMIRFGAMASVLLLLTADVAQAQEAGSAGDPLNVINSVMIEKDGTTGKLDRTEIPRTAFGIDRTDPKPKEDAKQPDSEPSRLHPELARLLKEGDANERIPLLITLREDVAFPRFPDLAPGETRDSAAAAELRGRQEELVEGLRQARSKSQARLLETFRQQFRLEVKEQYWLINGFLAE
ncbi:MAG: hypothetical protein ACRDI2_06120, partial [Chloroflexota bacterium]